MMLKKEGKLGADLAELKLIVGNRHQLLGEDSGNNHEWTIFCELANKDQDVNKIIEYVTFGLHPTFGVVQVTACPP